MADLIFTIFIVHAICKINNQYLFVQERDETWSIPGGKVKSGEDPLTGLIREVKEEAGINSRPLGLIAVYHTSRKYNEQIIARTHFIFEIEPIDPTLKSLPDKESLKAEWINTEKISLLMLRSPDILNLIAEYEKAKKENTILPIKYFHTDVFL